MKKVQVDLSRGEPPTQTMLTTWIDVKFKLRPGVLVTLKEFDPNMWWKVQKVYETELEAVEVSSNRNWDNNNYDHHKGLNLNA